MARAVEGRQHIHSRQLPDSLRLPLGEPCNVADNMTSCCRRLRFSLKRTQLLRLPAVQKTL